MLDEPLLYLGAAMLGAAAEVCHAQACLIGEKLPSLCHLVADMKRFLP